MTNTPAPSTSVSAGLALLRIALGIVFAVHGLQKFITFTIPGVTEMFTGLGVPAAGFVAPATAVVEIVGGVLIALGILTRPLAVIFAAISIGAIFYVHAAAGFFVSDGGYEFVLLLAVASIAVALTGGGRWSLDHALLRGRVPAWLA